MNAPFRFPGKVAVKRVIEAARAAGLDVGGVSVAPDGTVQVIEARLAAPPPADLFEQLERDGKL